MQNGFLYKWCVGLSCFCSAPGSASEESFTVSTWPPVSVSEAPETVSMPVVLYWDDVLRHRKLLGHSCSWITAFCFDCKIIYICFQSAHLMLTKECSWGRYEREKTKCFACKNCFLPTKVGRKTFSNICIAFQASGSYSSTSDYPEVTSSLQVPAGRGEGSKMDHMTAQGSTLHACVWSSSTQPCVPCWVLQLMLCVNEQ